MLAILPTLPTKMLAPLQVSARIRLSRRCMETHMADIEWKLLPTPMWPEGSVLADLPGLVLEVSFDEGVLTWKVQRHKGKSALSDLVASGTADSFEAAKATVLHVAKAAS